MVRKLVLSLIAVLGAGALLVEAQNRQISGTVTNPDGQPIAGATVLVDGTSQGTTTGSNGKFSVTAPANGTLTVSFIGYESQQVAIAGKSVLDVTLAEDTQAIDDVIVVAYGTAKKESFTGSAAVIKSENLEKRVVSNVSKALEGQVAGVQTTSGTGQPGSSASVSIRGFGSINASSQPLYVVDGVAYSGSINAINPDDIESITVLKDASAGALYGARGANGVIVITTKRGRQGDIDVNFKATLGVSSRAIPNYDLVDQREYVELNWQSLYNSAYFTGGYTDAAARQYASSRLAGTLGAKYNPFTNYSWADLVDPATGKVRADAVSAWNESWIDEVTDNAAFRQEYQASISGGNNIHRGSMSISFLDEDGILKTTSFQRYTGRVSYDTTPKHWFSGGMNANFAHSKSNTNRYTGSSNSNVFYTAQLTAPIYPVYMKDAEGKNLLDENGKKQYDYGETRPQDTNTNVIAGFYDDPTSNTTESLSARTYLTFGSDSEKAGALQGLKFAVNFGVDYQMSNNMQYFNRLHGNQASNGGLIYKYNYRYMTYTFNQLLTYNRTFGGKHEVNALLGHEYYSYEENYLEASRSGLVEGLYEVVGATINSAESTTYDHRIESYFARLNYGYDNKYYIDASWRTDGSSRFAPDTRWGHFWSVGASWRISQEQFMKNVSWVDNLTLKASYGVQGNEGILDASGYDNYYGWQGYYDVNSTGTSYGFSVAQLSNPGLTWEKNANFNIGIEAALFGSRLNVEVEYYNRKTTDMILERPMAFSSGFESYLDNIGEMRNTGWEISLNGVLIDKPDMRWDLTVMAATQTNKVLKLTPETPEIVDGSRIIREGLPIYTFYMPKFAGVDPATGAALYWAYDKDDEGNIANEYITSDTAKASGSRYYCGNRIPDLFGSIGTNFRWKGLDVSILTTYSIGGKVNEGIYGSTMNPFYYGQTFHKHQLRAWKQPGDITDVPRVEVGTSSISSDRFLVDASYFAIKNITVGYTIPRKAAGYIGMKSVRVYCSLDNLAIFTHLKGMNPTYSLTGSTGFVYTPSRSFVAGLDIKF
ncbi:MAG: TonB-dependent receptor [Alistipes sp.]|nr:TonB-dependent receptor [Alistipes sp.]